MAYRNKKNKYGVSKKEERTYNNITFASKAEMKRYKELLLLLKAGQIFDIELQPEFVLQEKFEHNGTKYCGIKYRGDFGYFENNKRVIEDVKGHITKEYTIKKKLLLKKYPEIDFREIKAS